MSRNGRKGLPRRDKKQNRNELLWGHVGAKNKRHVLPAIAILGVLAILFEKVMFLLGNMGGAPQGSSTTIIVMIQ